MQRLIIFPTFGDHCHVFGNVDPHQFWCGSRIRIFPIRIQSKTSFKKYLHIAIGDTFLTGPGGTIWPKWYRSIWETAFIALNSDYSYRGFTWSGCCSTAVDSRCKDDPLFKLRAKFLKFNEATRDREAILILKASNNVENLTKMHIKNYHKLYFIKITFVFIMQVQINTFGEFLCYRLHFSFKYIRSILEWV